VDGGSDRDLAARLAQFAAALRARGVRVGLGDELDGAAALALVDLLDRAEVHRALRIALKIPRDAWALFDALFQAIWDGAPPRDPPRLDLPRDHRGPAQWRWDGARVRLALADEDEALDGDTPGYSDEPMLRRKPFDRCSAAEIATLERMLRRVAPRLAARRTRRLVPVRTRGHVDLRRSLRHALRSEGDLVRLARRDRPIETPSLVVLYDTSGSMDAHTRLLLALGFALRRAIRKVELFAFNTALVPVTRLVEPAEVDRTLARLAASVPDWSGGTRIGACLEAFNAQHLDRMASRRTTVVILSDGLDHGDAAALGRAMRALRERVGRVVWLNPLAGDPRYRPETDGMRAALPYVDHFGPAHNLEALEALLRLVR
jgi:uncharacterized protein with von Willebrand factor type A (vWA) domain